MGLIVLYQDKMGITIHYRLEKPLTNTKSNKELIKKIIGFVKETADKFGYENFVCENEKGFCQKSITKGADGKEDLNYWTSEFFNEDSNYNEAYKESGFKENENQKKVIFNSICVNNKVNGEFMSESFEVGFYLNPFTKKIMWFGSGFTKTQIFNARETIPNLKFHIYIIKVLEQIKLRFLPDLYINDEGDFFFTEEERQEQVKSWEKHLKNKNSPYNDIAEKHLKKWKMIKPYNFKNLVEAHGSNLKLISSISGKLGNLGYNQTQIETPVENGDEFLKRFYNNLCEVLGV